MAFRAPGLIPGASDEVVAAWNDLIAREQSTLLRDPNLARAANHLASPDVIGGEPISVHWTADPAEPRFCLDADWARKLSDWGVEGRHLFHNEYCEYAVVTRVDDQNRVRPKRFTATTELAEWWTTVATYDPAYLAEMAADVLGRPVGAEELYGAGTTDPGALAPDVRRVLFARHAAGHGQHQDLVEAGVPLRPVGEVNRENALFMSHQINGLDDLLYIVLVGAQPYVVEDEGGARLAESHEIFEAQGTTELACRSADPAAAQGAYGQVLRSVAPDRSSARGCRLAFADPLGMYISSFQDDQLSYRGEPVPESWTRLRRGRPGFEQRLEFGPSDDEPAFLDDVVLHEGAAETPVTGGYQLARLVEVGPQVLVGPEEDIEPDWFVIEASTPPDCSVATVCSDVVGPARARYEQAAAPVGLRGR